MILRCTAWVSFVTGGVTLLIVSAVMLLCVVELRTDGGLLIRDGNPGEVV